MPDSKPCNSCKSEIPDFPAWADLFRRAGVPTTYPPATTIIAEGQPLAGLGVVCTGVVKASITTSAGKSVVLSIHKPGELIGVEDLLSGRDSSAQYSAVFESTICTVPWRDFQNAAAWDSKVLDALARQLSHKIRKERERMRVVLSPSVKTRMISFISSLRKGLTPQSEAAFVSFPYTHDQLAEIVGCTRESVGRLLAAFSAAGLIERHGSRLKLSSEFERKANLRKDAENKTRSKRS